ncbi:hypothetical protein GBA52_025461 [Prunus armeniaca]|nr:hypothetical protein GBA52_025461 [Prunus armeniaca]
MHNASASKLSCSPTCKTDIKRPVDASISTTTSFMAEGLAAVKNMQTNYYQSWYSDPEISN